jgi:quinol-cytochrome oxidoreductase complex cytochrome b subunit
MSLTNNKIWQSVFRSDRPASKGYNALLHLHPRTISREKLRFTSTFCMGGLTFLMFLVLTVTGVLLMFFYVPETGHAYRDMKDLEYVIPFGGVMRNLHRWSAHAMVLFVVLHMARVFYHKAYRPPREFNWVIGIGCLVLTLLLSFTGYLLPWDQLAYWAITVGTNMMAYAPVVGSKGPLSMVGAENDIRYFVLGANGVGQIALLRFYVLHVFFLPAILFGFVFFHFWRIRKDNQLKRPL